MGLRNRILFTLSVINILVISMLSGCGNIRNIIAENNVEIVEETEFTVEGTLEVHYIDVGQADATLIMCNGKNMLIDGGNVDDSSLIYAYLKEHGVDKLDYMIATHAHEDHVGGLAGALNYAQVETVLCPVLEYDSECFTDFVKYVERQNKEIVIPKAGQKFELGEARCTVLAVNTMEDDPNNTSIVLKIVFGKNVFLFSGDAEVDVEDYILDQGYKVKCTVLKVPHHGSDTSLGYRWLKDTMPQYGIISVGKENIYGHPCESTLSKLQDAEVVVYRTDMHGHIICTSDGKEVSFELQKEE